MNSILPVEHRVIVKTIHQGKELNSEEVSKILNNDKIKMKILAIRQDCFNKTIKNQNLYSFIYVHTDGEIEIDVNVSKSKYE
jgi:hypothetical protein